jgi:uncharacterized membrane protein
MSQFVVAVFEDEGAALAGIRAIEELRAEGSITLYGRALVQRDVVGTLAIRQRRSQGPLGLGVGALVGGLVSLFGGLQGGLLAWMAGEVPDQWRDYLHTEVSDEFLARVGRELEAGKAAVIVEVSEEWFTPLDLRVAGLGGVLMRERREELESQPTHQRVAAFTGI